MPTSPEDWSQLALFLAIYRERSLSRAALRLGVDQSTVSRRLAALEDRIGAPLFARDKTGAHPTSLARRWLLTAERAESAIAEAMALARTVGSEPVGEVRIATSEAVADFLIMPALPELLATWPGLRVVVDARSELTDLARLEADVALRFVRPDSGELLVRQVGTTPIGIFCAPSYLASRAGEPLERLDWVSWSPELASLPEARWLRSCLGVTPRVACNRDTTIIAAVRAGAGVALLPERFARRFEDLIEWPWPDGTPPRMEVFLVRAAVHRDTARVSVVADWLAGLVRKMA